MDLKEYEGKRLLATRMPLVSQGLVTSSPDEVEAYAREQGVVVVKAQVLTGGRGKAGGVKLAKRSCEARKHAEDILGMDIKGHFVEEVLVSPGVAIDQEWYFSIVFDRAERTYSVIFSTEGGVDIELVAEATPEKVIRFPLNPKEGLTPLIAEDIVRRAGLDRRFVVDVVAVLCSSWGLLVDKDLTLIEINPLVSTKEGDVVVLDAKVSVDDAALFRQAEFGEMQSQKESAEEALARENGFTFVPLDGDVGIIGNGAGLVMATMDAVKAAGGEPANFLDIGGGAQAKTVKNALALLRGNPKIRSILVNVFGGITRGDEVARGLLAAIAEQPLSVPLTIRLTGTRAKEGLALLEAGGLEVSGTMDRAAALAVAGK
ncbi:ADP-forming succinate--CoA ligase subunit beta [bacterium]|nr:ADP-forming succinate--CoA ligase subunit beta [bacterium]